MKVKATHSEERGIERGKAEVRSRGDHFGPRHPGWRGSRGV